MCEPRVVHHVECRAYCADCDWSSSSRSEVPARQHHRETGHTVDIERIEHVALMGEGER